MVLAGNDFNAVKISLASPEMIEIWSYGEVTKPETINYRTLRPEKDGLFCERIFGPTKDWECYCGKYKKMRYKGVICDRCGVEVARARVRRERMGHISLAAPVAHIWFSKGTPSRLGVLLDLSPRNLDRVLYFAQYLVTAVDEELREMRLEQLHKEIEDGAAKIDEDGSSQLASLQSELDALGEMPEETGDEEADVETRQPWLTLQGQLNALSVQIEEDKAAREEELNEQITELEGLCVRQLLTETKYRELRDRYAGIFYASMGAEAVLEILRDMDMEEEHDRLLGEMQNYSGQKRKKALKRLRVVNAFLESRNKPEWMVMTTLPVLPPELRPMVQLDGGRFATSDLNDLYRRVINRNNRLKRLIELQAPEIIVRNEKRMLQEAVDALVDNGRRGRAVAGSHNHRLKSLSDLLRGKQGRFRQNLLGKRVDYSGRSVIVAGPELKLNQCGLPRRMALELFKPFVMNRLMTTGYAHNIKTAKRMAERSRPEVWDILEKVVSERPVLLNRAPTLHRLGIQAFEPVLIDGSAIQLHPLVCTAFNADFDGDQMAVHVPLSSEAVMEARQMMLSTNNMLSPSSGQPIISPTLDIVLGTYYMTIIDEKARGAGRTFRDPDDAILAYELGSIDLRAPIQVHIGSRQIMEANDETGITETRTVSANERIKTSVGRVILDATLPEGGTFHNEEVEKGVLQDIVAEVYNILGNHGTAEVLDKIKTLGFEYATKAGITISISDLNVPQQKAEILEEAQARVDSLQEMYWDGMATETDLYRGEVETWTKANDDLTQIIENNLPNYGGIHLMASSGAKGNIAQIKQMAGMRGLMAGPRGRIISRPIKANFREGLSVSEYFLSTHGARKGLTDTALNTANSGYLTRRLIDVSQEIIILEDDCGSENGLDIDRRKNEAGEVSERGDQFISRLRSRCLAVPVADPATGEVIADRNDALDDPTLLLIDEAGVESVIVRSPMTCEAQRGICQMCYGLSLATLRPSMMGEAVGIIAAQSIGEPGTQLTMRTFHTGGVAGRDITSGLPRVEELFEARSPKQSAILAEIDGVVEVIEAVEGRSIKITSRYEYTEDYSLPEGFRFTLEDGDFVAIGQPLVEPNDDAEMDEDEDSLALIANEMLARSYGTASIEGDTLTIAWEEEDQREYQIPAAAQIAVSTGIHVNPGDELTTGPKNPQEVLRIQGINAVQRYLIDQVQSVYRSQGVPIHDKHIELIVSQMLRKVRVEQPGDSQLIPEELVDRREHERVAAEIDAQGGEPPIATPVLLGITRASLQTESFLASASFQETTRVLTEAAVNGKTDNLRGLKENVIIGRLIPAQLNLSEDGVSGLSREQANAINRNGMGIMTTGSDPADQILLGGSEPSFGFDERIANERIEPEPLVIDEYAIEATLDDD